MNTLLSNTTIKRACCLKNTDVDDPNHYKVNVKLPYVDALVPLSNVQKLSLYKKYNFMNKEIKIPASLCSVINYKGPDSSDGNNNVCDNFYSAYCENAKQMYYNDVSGLGDTYDGTTFSNYAPDCSCFSDTPQQATSVQAACYAKGCLPKSKGVYIDVLTRKNGACTINQCNSFLDMGQVKADTGGKIDLGFQLNQTCGDFKNTALNKGAQSAIDNNTLLYS